MPGDMDRPHRVNIRVCENTPLDRGRIEATCRYRGRRAWDGQNTHSSRKIEAPTNTVLCHCRFRHASTICQDGLARLESFVRLTNARRLLPTNEKTSSSVSPLCVRPPVQDYNPQTILHATILSASNVRPSRSLVIKSFGSIGLPFLFVTLRLIHPLMPHSAVCTTSKELLRV